MSPQNHSNMTRYTTKRICFNVSAYAKKTKLCSLTVLSVNLTQQEIHLMLFVGCS